MLGSPRIFLAHSDSMFFYSSRDAAEAVTSIDVDIARDLAARTSFGAGVDTALKTVLVCLGVFGEMTERRIFQRSPWLILKSSGRNRYFSMSL